MFCPAPSDWAALCGFACAMILFLPLKFEPGIGNATGTRNFTHFAEPQTIYFFARFYALITQFLVTMTLSCVPLKNFAATPSCMRIDTTAFDPTGQTLTRDQVTEAMKDTGEIFKDMIAVPIIVFIFIAATLGIPNFGDSHDNCNFVTFGDWYDAAYPTYDRSIVVDDCKSTAICAGLPCYLWPVMIIFPMNKILIIFCYTRWLTVDEESLGCPWGPVKEVGGEPHPAPNIMISKSGQQVEPSDPPVVGGKFGELATRLENLEKMEQSRLEKRKEEQSRIEEIV